MERAEQLLVRADPEFARWTRDRDEKVESQKLQKQGEALAALEA